MRAWIEIYYGDLNKVYDNVALFVRAWIEIPTFGDFSEFDSVALFVRAWIEIVSESLSEINPICRSLRESVD